MSNLSSDSASRMSQWREALGWMKDADKALPGSWPPEFPPETTPDFWFVACRHEMATRKQISVQIRSMIESGDTGTPSPLEGWLIRRRIEWAGQVALAAVTKNVEPAEGLAETLYEILVVSWERDGCIGMWNHAERGGKPHPENPDGLSPLPPN